MPSILMIDDDADFTTLVSMQFGKLGYAVTVASNGREGLAKAPAAKPDVIFLDVMMPEMNGLEVLRELQSLDETSGVPVIVMSGRFFDGGMADVFRQEPNFKEFIPKPVRLAQLEATVAGLVRK